MIVSLLAAFLNSALAHQPKLFYDMPACAGCKGEKDHAD